MSSKSVNKILSVAYLNIRGQSGLTLGSLPLGVLEESYKVIGYADDVKPAIICMEEFLLVDQAMLLFENASGCRLHRDPASQKCKFLPLARWRGTLEQADIPCVELRATWTQTRKANCDIIQDRVEKTVRQWKSGKFMPLTMRGWSMNTYCLTKVWFRAHSVDLRLHDITKINSHVKSWVYGRHGIVHSSSAIMNWYSKASTKVK